MIPTPLPNASLNGILYYRSPNRDFSDRPILLRFDILILLRRQRRLVPRPRLCDVDDVDLFLEDFTFVIDRTAFYNLLTLRVFLFSADFIVDVTVFFAALFAFEVPCCIRVDCLFCESRTQFYYRVLSLLVLSICCLCLQPFVDL